MPTTSTQEHKLIAAYYRVSTSAQEENQTIQTQIAAVKEFAEKNGYMIVKEYKDDGWSGDTLVRPELDQLRMDAKEKLWDGVLVYDPDRLARRYSYQELVRDELVEAGKEVIYVTTPAPKNDEDKILHGVKGLFAQYERAKISERFRLGKVRKVKEGHILTTESKYGYIYIPKREKVHGYYEINEGEARVVEMIFKWIADEGVTIREVIRRLKDLKIRPRKSKSGFWSTSTLSTMLRHEIYIGKAHWGKSYAVVPLNPFSQEKYRKTKKSSRKDRPKEDWYIIEVPSIISKDLFDRAQEQLKTNFALCDRNKKNEYLLAGRVWCDCGCRRSGEGPMRGKHLYYRCTGRISTFPLPPTCIEGGINARIADRLVWEKISELMSSSTLMQKQVSRWMDDKKKKAHSSVTDVSLMEKEIGKLKDQEERYAKAYGAGVFTIEKLKEYNLPIRERIQSLEMQVAKARQEQGQIYSSAKPTKEEIEEFSKQATKELKNLSFPLRKAIVMNTIEKAVGTREKLQVYGYIPITDVGFKTISRYRWSAKRGEVHAL